MLHLNFGLLPPLTRLAAAHAFTPHTCSTPPRSRKAEPQTPGISTKKLLLSERKSKPG